MTSNELVSGVGFIFTEITSIGEGCLFRLPVPVALYLFVIEFS